MLGWLNRWKVSYAFINFFFFFFPQECVREHEANMEYSFLVAQSKDKECSICMEVVFEKTPPENRFGLLPNCNHVFCLTCIRTWRSSTLEKDVIRYFFFIIT